MHNRVQVLIGKPSVDSTGNSTRRNYSEEYRLVVVEGRSLACVDSALIYGIAAVYMDF